MADLSDVLGSLAALVAGVMYPSGTGQLSAAGCHVRIYPGWPNRELLDRDLRDGVAHLSVYGMQQETNTTRYFYEWRELSRQVQGIEFSTDDRDVTLSGTIQPGDIVTVTVSGGAKASVAVQEASTLASIASGLAALLLAAEVAGTSSTGAVLTIGGLLPYTVKIGVQGVQAREIRRADKMIMVSVWANSNDQRSAVAKVADGVLSELARIEFPDGTRGKVRYAWGMDNDDPQEALLYRRDMVFWVEYPTIQTREAVEVTSTTSDEVGDNIQLLP